MDKSDRRLVLYWVLLTLLTFASFESTWGVGWLSDPQVAIALVIGVAFLKVRIVVLEFMEVRHAPGLLRLPLEAWIIATASGILAFWYLSRA
jgi:hypothetical protein